MGAAGNGKKGEGDLAFLCRTVVDSALYSFTCYGEKAP